MVENLEASWWLIAGYLILMLGIGILGRGKVTTIEDMAVAGRRSGVWLIAFSVAATWINGTTLVGNSALGRDFGLSSYWAGGSFLFVTVWIGYYVVPRLRETGIITIPELFERFFGPAYRLIALVLVILRDLGVTAGTLGALTVVTTALLDISAIESQALWLGVTVIYVFLGGMWAVLVTDSIQFVIIVAGTVGLLFSGIGQLGGLSELGSRVDPILLDLSGRAGGLQVLGWIVIGIAVTCGYQGIIQRGFAASSPETARKGFLYGGVLGILWYMVPPLIGLLGLALHDSTVRAEDTFVRVAFDSASSQMATLIVVSVLAASMSTLSSTINTLASNFTLDIYQRFIDPRSSMRRRLWVYRINVILIGLLAALIYYLVPLLIELFWLGGRIMGSSVAPALVALVMFPAVRRAPKTVLATMILGATTVAALQIFGAVQEVGSVVIIWRLDPILVGFPIAVLTLCLGTWIETRGTTGADGVQV